MKIPAEAKGSESPDCGPHSGACVGAETQQKRAEHRTQERAVDVPCTGADQRCEWRTGEGGQRPRNNCGSVMQIVEDVSTLPPPVPPVAMLQTSARSNPETGPVRAAPAQHHGAEAVPVVRAAVDGAEATQDGGAIAARGLEVAGATVTRVGSVRWRLPAGPARRVLLLSQEQLRGAGVPGPGHGLGRW